MDPSGAGRNTREHRHAGRCLTLVAGLYAWEDVPYRKDSANNKHTLVSAFPA